MNGPPASPPIPLRLHERIASGGGEVGQRRNAIPRAPCLGALLMTFLIPGLHSGLDPSLHEASLLNERAAIHGIPGRAAFWSIDPDHDLTDLHLFLCLLILLELGEDSGHHLHAP